MRSFAFITSNTKSGRLSRPLYTKATQSSRCCGVASIMLNFVQILNLLSTREILRAFKWTEVKLVKAVWFFLSPLKCIIAPGSSLRYHECAGGCFQEMNSFCSGCHGLAVVFDIKVHIFTFFRHDPSEDLPYLLACRKLKSSIDN
ncbi:hypothetical protein AVEN_177064-1 [Araneus ventricosus]|uniref:Uncharacterized protein n=1 Tax=Araneus ventricosus TaxID=182803 RepID=A0A4Y2CT36_ARAVE|nr:hypothetical protein AVEN_177064-1 [Araneus ventricosus]